MFTQSDIRQLEERGINPDAAKEQLSLIKQGSFELDLVRPAVPGDGITCFSEKKKGRLKELWEKQGPLYPSEKFVPASGAATRMFKDLYAFISGEKPSELVQSFFQNLHDFPFYTSLCDTFQNHGWTAPWTIEKQKELITYLLGEEGQNWGSLPKGLLPFHRIEGNLRTPAGEHLSEGRFYAANSSGEVKIHFTVSPSAKNIFQKTVSQESRSFPENTFDISFSFQDPSTDTLALDEEENPFRLNSGELLFRPGGHGALLKNLNQRESDLLFIKNIDNVQKTTSQGPSRDSFCQMAGYLLEVREKLRKMEQQWLSGILPEERKLIEDLKLYCGIDFSGTGSILNKKENILQLLNSPIRICGMVKNEGEPGGGPFWVRQKGGEASLQIVESAQVDLSREDYKEIMKKSTHFNPVFLVCLKQDLKGNRLNLENFTQKEACFVAEKSLEGRKLRALEHPGLWNGAMARWITLFVEIPTECFTPVKTIEDLLRKEHR